MTYDEALAILALEAKFHLLVKYATMLDALRVVEQHRMAA
jgi:hypothetical protein